MSRIPLVDKVNWCTKQVDNTIERGQKLGQRHLADTRNAVSVIDQASTFIPSGKVQSENREIISDLQELSRM